MSSAFKYFGVGLASWFRKKLDPLLQILRRGAEPKQLAFSGALGITLGVFPICGVTVFLCGMAIAVLRSSCHAPTVMLANFIATPIEFSLIIFFLRFGGIPYWWTSFSFKFWCIKEGLDWSSFSGGFTECFARPVGLVRSCTFHLGRSVLVVFATFYILGTQVQHSFSIKSKEVHHIFFFKSKEATPYGNRGKTEDERCMIMKTWPLVHWNTFPASVVCTFYVNRTCKISAHNGIHT